MKKILEKITTIALAVISILFIALIWVIMFKPEIAVDLKNDLVYAFVILLSSTFVILTTLNIYSAFVDNERLSDVLLFKDRESATKATVGVVKKTAKRITKNMEEAKIKKVTLYSDVSGNISMNVEIKVKSDETMNVVTKVRALLIKTFDEIFGIEFSAINFRVTTSKNKFVPKDEDVQAKVDELKATLVSNKPAPGKVQVSKITGHIEDAALVVADTTQTTTTPEESVNEENSANPSLEALEEIQQEENAEEDAVIEEKAETLEENLNEVVEAVEENTSLETSEIEVNAIAPEEETTPEIKDEEADKAESTLEDSKDTEENKL